MAGLRQIQITTSLYYEDGIVVSFNSPVYSKDIRTGDLFSEEQVCEVIKNSGDCLSEMIEEKTLNGFHTEVSMELNKKKFMYGTGFSDN